MRRVLKFILLFSAVFSYSYSYCQYSVKGKVIDSKTKEPLTFVNIVFNSDLHFWATTDIDGKFIFNQSQKIITLSCGYLGYEKITSSLDSIRKDNNGLIIELIPSAFNLHEVVIKPGENPANRIIRKVIQNKIMNDPGNISSFKYTVYNKTIFDFVQNDTLGMGKVRNKMDRFQNKLSDRLKKNVEKKLKGTHLSILESVTERKYISPDINEAIIRGSRVSGFKDPSFVAFVTDVQPFSFYKDIITIFDINYLNPISDGSLKKYQFNILDTLYQNSDTVFILSFKPQNGTNFQALTGLLYINTNKYAFQNVIAEPFEKGNIDIKIQQQYTFADNKRWFPKQFNFEVSLRNYPSKKMGMSINGNSYIENIELFPSLDKKDFSLESVKTDDKANERDSSFWDKYRTKPLTIKEAKTYHVIDSIGEKKKFEAWLHLFENIAQNKIPIKFIDLVISETIVKNEFEGTRIGLGAHTNDNILKFLSIGGFCGYGLQDHQWKYGEELNLSINKNKEIKIIVKHQNTLLETGYSNLNPFNLNFDFRSFMAYRMDKTEQNSFSVGFRAIKYAKLNFSLKHSFVTPQYAYEYEYVPGGLQKSINYTTSDITINLRYAYKEKFIKILNQRVSIGTKYPIIYLTYSRGIKSFYNSAFDFNKVEARIEKYLLTKNLGETNLRIDGGYIDKPIPYGLLFTGEGSFDRNLSILIKNSFQTVTPYEFLSDRYINFYFSHNFSSLLFHINRFKPHITFYQNAGWGLLSHSENHKSVEFETKEKGLYESGLQLDNIIKINYLNTAYIGLGAGVYCRYGAYAYKNAGDNLAFKLSLTLTTK